MVLVVRICVIKGGLDWWHIKQCYCLQEAAEAAAFMCLVTLMSVKCN
jgi:hypothetical protein